MTKVAYRTVRWLPTHHFGNWGGALIEKSRLPAMVWAEQDLFSDGIREEEGLICRVT